MDQPLQNVRHHLECSVQAWSPWYRKDIELLEQVEIRAVKIVEGLKSVSYEKKLKEISLTSLQDRRMRGDMIQVWKYLHGQSPGGDKLFNRVNDQQRFSRHTSKVWNLTRIPSRLDVRKNFFVPRVVATWNSLPHQVQASENLNSFKNAYDNMK